MNATQSKGHGPQESVAFTAIRSASLGPTICKGRKICWGKLERVRKVTLLKSDNSESEEEE